MDNIYLVWKLMGKKNSSRGKILYIFMHFLELLIGSWEKEEEIFPFFRP